MSARRVTMTARPSVELKDKLIGFSNEDLSNCRGELALFVARETRSSGKGKRSPGKTAPSDPVWLNPVQAAARIGMSRDFIYEAIKTRGLPHVKHGTRSYRIHRDQLDEWVGLLVTTCGEVTRAA